MTDRSDEPTVWRMTLGQEGKLESDALENSLVFVGFGIEVDLAGRTDDQIADIVAERWPEHSDGKRRSRATKLSMLAARMKIGDLVVVYLREQIGNLAIGRIVGEYEFDESRMDVPHTRKVDWIRPSIRFSEDWEPLILYVRERSTINPVRHEETIAKVRHEVEVGEDTAGPAVSIVGDAAETKRNLPVGDIAKLQVATLIDERFPGKEMERLVAGVLDAEGYTIAPPVGGSDNGVDVVAGHGLLGFEEPLICVQVKHTRGRTDSATVQQLRGAVEQFGAKQGLFVSWGGYTSAAINDARQNFFRVRLWDANDLIEAVCRNYGHLSAELRAQIPLQQVWAVISDSDEA